MKKLSLNVLLIGALLCWAFGSAAVASQLIVYYDGDGKGLERAAKIFTKETRVNVLIKHGEPEALFKKLMEEGEGTQADVYITKQAAFLEQGRDAGLFQNAVKLGPEFDGSFGDLVPGGDMEFGDMMLDNIDRAPFPHARDITKGLSAKHRAEDDSWLGLGLSARVLFFNRDSEDAYAVTSVFDLADPKWKGRLAMASFYDEDVVSSIVALRKAVGDKKLDSWLRGVKENLNGEVYASQSEAMDALTSGEKQLGWLNHGYLRIDLSKSVSEAKVEMLIPDSGAKDVGAPWNMMGMAALKTSQNIDFVHEFFGFLLSHNGQGVLHHSDGALSINFSAPPDPNLIPDTDFKVLEVPKSLLAAQRGEVIDLLKSLEMP